MKFYENIQHQDFTNRQLLKMIPGEDAWYIAGNGQLRQSQSRCPNITQQKWKKFRTAGRKISANFFSMGVWNWGIRPEETLRTGVVENFTAFFKILLKQIIFLFSLSAWQTFKNHVLDLFLLKIYVSQFKQQDKLFFLEKILTLQVRGITTIFFRPYVISTLL